MIYILELKRFRGFGHLKVSDLSRVNLIIGRNNAGKTSVLEALFLLAGPNNPELAIRLNALRGIDTLRNDPAELWGWVFPSKNMSQAAEIVAISPSGKRQSLTIRAAEPTETRSRSVNRPRAARPAFAGSASSAATSAQLDYVFVGQSGVAVRSSAVATDAGVSYARGTLKEKPPQTIFMTSRAGYVAENAERFSQLAEVGKEDDLLPHLQKVEPRLKRLAVLVVGMGPVVHGDLGEGRMIPLHYMGDGLSRLLSIVLAIATSPGGTVLVDDVDSGLHYSVLSEVWGAIADAAAAHNVQIFTTTHNWECLRAAAEHFGSRDDAQFSAQRVERRGDKTEAVAMNAELLESAVLSGVEVR